jgi:transcriptional regulator with XRE-family HTH domain
LGEQLRKLRNRKKLTGIKAAEKAGISQSKLSKIETGLLLPSTEDLSNLCLVYTVSKPQLNALLEQLRRIQTEYISWRIGHQRGFAAKQKDVGAQESKAKHIKTFQVSVVPGLLQIPRYAQCVMRLANVTAQQDLEQAVGVRLQRQSILYDPTKNFDFLITEGALLSRFCNPDIVIQQLDRLQLFFDLPNITLGLIPRDRPLPIVPQNSFVIFDRDQVTVETLTASVEVFNEQDILLYMQTFEQFQQSAVYGDAAVEYLNQLKAELRKVAKSSA